jgi:hypothetical protein
MSPIACTCAKPSAPRAPATRTCCVLCPEAPWSLFFATFGVGIVDPATIGSHSSSGGDVFGQLYTCSGGFVDIAHLRDTADLTRYYHEWLTKFGKNAAGDPVPTFFYPGTVTIKTAVPAGDRIAVARSLAYDEAAFHEIESYWEFSPGKHLSAFSPEDLVSNFLGTYVAGKAIAAGGSFDTAMTTEINSLLTTLGARTPAQTSGAFATINGDWIKSLSLTDSVSNDYTRRRNFKLSPIVPSLVPGAPGCVATAWPGTVDQSLPAAIATYYEVEFDVPTHALAKIGSPRLKNTAFAAAIGTIKADAAARYGASHEAP